MTEAVNQRIGFYMITASFMKELRPYPHHFLSNDASSYT